MTFDDKNMRSNLCKYMHVLVYNSYALEKSNSDIGMNHNITTLSFNGWAYLKMKRRYGQPNDEWNDVNKVVSWGAY